jgi:Arc/MetJ-type ribon-helix-helix transcriptional regulator
MVFPSIATKGIASRNISLPQTRNEFVEKQAEEGGYGTPSEYVRQLGEDQR